MHFFRRAPVALMFAVSPFIGTSLLGEVLTEDEAYRRFLEESPRVRALSARIEVVRAETRMLTLPPNPILGYIQEDAGGTEDEFVTVEQTIPLTGRLGLLRQAGFHAISAAQDEAAFELLQLGTEFRLVFYDFLLLQKKEAIFLQGEEQFTEIVRILREREREGEGSGFDRIRAEREAGEISADLASVQELVAGARFRLASFFAPGIDSTELTVSGDFHLNESLPSLEELLTGSLGTRRDYQAQHQRLELYEFSGRAARRKRIPEPILVAGWKRVSTPGTIDDGYVVSVAVPVPLFNRGQVEAARARAAYETTEKEHEALRQKIEMEIRAAYASARLRRRLAEEYGHGLGEKAEDITRIARLSYEEGEQGILTLLDSYRVALFSQIRALELVAEAKRAELELARASGLEELP